MREGAEGAGGGRRCGRGPKVRQEAAGAGGGRRCGRGPAAKDTRGRRAPTSLAARTCSSASLCREGGRRCPETESAPTCVRR